MGSSGRSDGFSSRIASLREQDCYGLALIHLNSCLESAVIEDIEDHEAGHLEWFSADIEYDRALERARNQQIDDGSEYRLLDIDAIDGVASEQYCFQVLDEIAAARRDYAHDIEAYGNEEVGRHDSIDIEDATRYGIEVCQQLS